MARHPKIVKLVKQSELAMSELMEATQKARAEIAARIRQAASKRIMSATVRESTLKQVAGLYAQLSDGLDDVLLSGLKRTAKDWHQLALQDIRKDAGKVGEGVTEFDPSRVDTYFRMVNPDSAKNLTAVYTQSLSQENLQALRQSFVEITWQGSLEGWTAQQEQKHLQARWMELAAEVSDNMFVDKRGRSWTNARYLDMLSRTTDARISRDSYFDTLISNGDDLAQVQNVDDEACPICQAWDGVIISISGNEDKFPSYQDALDAGWGHPNCVLGDTEIVAPDAKKILRAFYDGPVIEMVFASGRRLAVTPNHMLLTPSGFAFAQSLREGDDVLTCAIAKSVSVGVPNDDLSKTRIADIFSAIQESSAVSIVLVPVTAENLHGDGRRCDGDIDVIGADGLLLDAIKTSGTELIAKVGFSLGGANAQLLASGGNLAAMLSAVGRASDSSMGSFRESLAVLWAGSGHACEHPRASVAGDYPVLNQDATYNLSGVTDAIGQSLLGFPGAVTTDKIVSIKIGQFVGHVYDLHCESTMYVANGVLSSNCRCTSERVDEDLDKDEIELQKDLKTPSDLEDVEAVAAYSEDFTRLP